MIKFFIFSKVFGETVDSIFKEKNIIIHGGLCVYIRLSNAQRVKSLHKAAK